MNLKGFEVNLAGLANARRFKFLYTTRRKRGVLRTKGHVLPRLLTLAAPITSSTLETLEAPKTTEHIRMANSAERICPVERLRGGGPKGQMDVELDGFVIGDTRRDSRSREGSSRGGRVDFNWGSNTASSKMHLCNYK